MFGGNQNTGNTGFGFGSNPPQNQQPNTGAFGSGTGAFGSINTTSGTPTPLQRPNSLSDSPAFGGGGSAFGQRPAGTSTPISDFVHIGLFGSGTTSAFGQPQQNASNTSAFGSSGGFGANNNTTSAFGATSGSTGGGLFGAKPASGAFGSGSFGSGTTGAFGNTGAFGSTTNTTPQSGFGSGIFPARVLTAALTTFGQQSGSVVPVTGSQNPPYQVHSERETGQTYTTNFHAISMIPAYRNASFEVHP
jgi:nuclear pore complex protein Nup98-Nup96